MIVTGAHLSRRTVLRGAGAAVALPLLDAMVPALVPTARTAAAPVMRFGAFYVAMGMQMNQWTPAAEGTTFELPPILSAIAPHRDQLLVLTGLDDEEAQNRPGDSGGIHSRSQSTWLTGVRAKRTDGPDFRVGTSVDQIIAKAIGGDTQLNSLEMTLEAGDVVGSCDYSYTCAYTSTVAWRTPTTPLPTELNPRAVFETLFGDADSTDARARLARIRDNASLLDSVSADLARMDRKLGARDRTKVAEYLDALRAVEKRIQKAEEQSARELPVVEQPVGVPASYEEHAKLMFDLLLLAYQTDLTRVSTFMLSRELSGRSYPEIGITEGNHPLSHHQNDPEKTAKQAKLNTFHMKLYAYFLDKMKATPDGDGSLLDHTVMLYGSGMSDSNLHWPGNLPTLIVGGRKLGIPTGRHVKFPGGTPLANLHLALMDKFGVRMESFGDSKGRLSVLG
jgi:hypothetical protein